MSAPSPSANIEFSNTRQPEASPQSDVQPAPAKGRPRREANDSLWKRAKRTLGTSSLTFLQPQSRSSQASTSGTGPAPPAKRREQVRQAQKVHRQRTQNYIKTLESEVVRLRGSETNLMHEKDKLLGQIDLLKTTLNLSNIPLPTGVDPLPTLEIHNQQTSSPESITVSYFTDEMRHDRLHLNWSQPPMRGAPPVPQNVTQSATPSASQHYHNHLSAEGPQNSPDDFSLQRLNLSPSIPHYEKVPSTQEAILLDTPDVAIEFVLALEHPCMTHFRHPATTPSDVDPSFHVYMASAPILSSAPSPPGPNTMWSWSASGSIIQELLNLSSSINLEGEITPVEAWHRLRLHTDFWRFDRVAIDGLKNELSHHVRCCGFGAVLDELFFYQTLNKHLAKTYDAQYQG